MCNVLRRCLKIANDGVEELYSDVRWKTRLPTADRRTGGTVRRWEAEDRNSCLVQWRIQGGG